MIESTSSSLAQKIEQINGLKMIEKNHYKKTYIYSARSALNHQQLSIVFNSMLTRINVETNRQHSGDVVDGSNSQFRHMRAPVLFIHSFHSSIPGVCFITFFFIHQSASFFPSLAFYFSFSILLISDFSTLSIYGCWLQSKITHCLVALNEHVFMLGCQMHTQTPSHHRIFTQPYTQHTYNQQTVEKLSAYTTLNWRKKI